jgi:hypothetical protein
MNTADQYVEVIKNEFYLDVDGNVRRSNDGYHGRFTAHDIVTGFLTPHGYLRIQVPRHRATIHLAHVVLILRGIELPANAEVDHIDGNRLNNHPTNLRVVSRRENSCNRRKRRDNTSGVTGIRWSAYHRHYVIRRTVHGKRVSTSRKTLEAAKAVLQDLHKQDTTYTDRHGK